MSSKAHCPQPWGERVGGVSGEPARTVRERRSNPAIHSAARVATVEDTLIRWMPSAFAGWRRNASLGRSVSLVGGSSPASKRTDDSGCPLGE